MKEIRKVRLDDARHITFDPYDFINKKIDVESALNRAFRLGNISKRNIEIFWHTFSGNSIAEIAKIYGLSEVRVRFIINNTLKLIKANLRSLNRQRLI
jgi:DNA-binding CsgD family transcriptional regulator